MNKIQHTQCDESDSDDDNDNNSTTSHMQRRSATPHRGDNSGFPHGRRQVDQDWCVYQFDTGMIMKEATKETMTKVLFEQTNSHTKYIERKFLLDTSSTIRAMVMNQDLITNICISDWPILHISNKFVPIVYQRTTYSCCQYQDCCSRIWSSAFTCK